MSQIVHNEIRRQTPWIFLSVQQLFFFIFQVLGQVDHPEEVTDWVPNKSFGQVTGVAIDLNGNPVIFHRGNRIWDMK